MLPSSEADRGGLTAANTVARQRHTAVVCLILSCIEMPVAMHMHMVLTWDHKSPEDYRNAARKNILENYSSIQFVDVAVAEISKESDSYFKVRDGNGKVWNTPKSDSCCWVSQHLPEHRRL